MKNIIFLLTAIVIFAFTRISYAQIYLNSEKCDVYIAGKLPIKDVQIVEIGDSTFTIEKESSQRELSIEKLSKIKYKRGGFWTGAAIGSIASVAGWTLIGAAYGKDGAGYGLIFGLALAIPTGLVTGLIVEFASQSEDFIFTGSTLQAKTKRLKFVVEKHQK